MATKITLAELSRHNTEEDGWVAINNEIWEVSGFADLHPGGPDAILEQLGKDASDVYNRGHSLGLLLKHLGSDKRVGFLECQAPSPAEEDASFPGETGDAKPQLDSIINMQDFEEVASEHMPEKSWVVISGATDDCLTKVANHSWYQRLLLRPTVLNDVSKCDVSTTILDCKFEIPIFNAPTSLVKLAHPEGELALARAMAEMGTTIIIPTLSSHTLEEIVDVLPKGYPWFFQLYVKPDRTATAKMLQQASALGARAILVTVDLPVMSKREANERYEIRNAGPKAASVAMRARKRMPYQDPSAAPDLTWEDIKWISKLTQIPVMVKGIQTAADAKRALEAGCAGIYISNHGGRALDTAQPSILTLLEIQKHCPEVLEKMEVFIDGGIRRGTDILKAVCLGASAVCVGRPLLYALSYGTPGVVHALQILKNELRVAMQLAGITHLSQAGPDLVNTSELDAYVYPERHPYARRIVRSRM